MSKDLKDVILNYLQVPVETFRAKAFHFEEILVTLVKPQRIFLEGA